MTQVYGMHLTQVYGMYLKQVYQHLVSAHSELT